MNVNRPGLRRPTEPQGPGRRRIGQPPGPQRPADKSGLYVGLGVGGVILVIGLAVAMSSGGGDAPSAKKSVDPEVQADIDAARGLAASGKLAEARDAFDRIVANPAYAESKLLDYARQSARDIRQRIEFFQEAESAIKTFDDKVQASIKAQTAMSQADGFWAESSELMKKYGGTPTINKVLGIRADLERWRGTSDASAWENEYNKTKERIQRDHIATGNFKTAAEEWQRFGDSYSHPELKARVTTELGAVNKASATAATSLVQSAGSGATARAKLEEALPRFMGTDGQKIINQKLKTLN